MIGFLAGTVTFAYFVAAAFFARFWRKTGDRLFVYFSLAFVLFGVNQGLAYFLEVVNEPNSFVYALRVLGFMLILWAILEKNILRRRR
jgi:hypothetical protein